MSNQIVNSQGEIFNGLYIDTIFMTTDSNDTYFSDVDTTMSHVSTHLLRDSTTPINNGIKFTVQLTNGTGSTITFSDHNKYRLVICTRYINYESITGNDQAGDVYITLTSGSVDSSSSIYLGFAEQGVSLFSPQTWSGVGHNSGVNTETYIPDQYASGSTNAIIATDYGLYNSTVDGSWNPTMKVGDNQVLSSDYYNKIRIPTFCIDSVGGYTSQSGTSTTGAATSGGYTLDSNNLHGSTTPSITYTDGDWNIKFSDALFGSAVGDPHITTFNGEHYEFDYLGAFRLFENSTDENNIVINGLSEKGQGRWKTLQYIQKLYIQNNNKYILIDMGFRGTPVKVLESNGIEYNEEQLYFNKDARRYSFDSKYSTIDLDEPETDNLPALIRNEICFSIKDDKDNDIFNISLQNVNEYNLQPCRLIISNIQKDLITKSRGALVHRKYAPVSKLDNIKNLEALENPSIEDLYNIPELEIDPKLKNIQWQ